MVASNENLYKLFPKKRLLYFTIQINMLGGLAKIVIDKINWLVEHGYEVTLCNIERLDVVPAYPIDDRVKLLRGDISTEPGGVLTRLKGVIGAVKRVKEIIREEEPDVIVNAHCPLVTWILPWDFVRKPAARRFNEHEGSKLYESLRHEDSMNTKTCGTKVPIVVEMHQSRQGLEVFNRQFMSPFGRWLHRWSIRWIYSKYDRFVVLTNGDREAWNAKNCVTIPNFATVRPTEDFDPQKTQKFSCAARKPRCSDLPTDFTEDTDKGRKQIVMLARLMPQKRIDLMIRVWAKLAKDFPDWHVKVLGDGMQKEDLVRLTKKLGVEDTFLMPGAVKDVNAELEASDILCLTSEYEGFGIVLIEAMLKHVPVMAFEYVGVHDIIEDGVDGYVVPFGDVDAYAERLKSLMLSQDLRDSLAEKAQESVKKFDKECVMAKWEKLFNRF